MTNYWYIKIARNSKSFKKYEEYCINDKSIGIGFSIHDEKLCNTEKSLEFQCKKILEDKYKPSFDNYNKFINKIKKNDIVFLCRGLNEILYIAQIDSDYYYEKENDLPHRRKIKNIKKFNAIAPKEMVGTLYSV